MKAFPHIKYQTTDEEQGMDLRDYFAGLAMQAIVSREDDIANEIPSLKAVSEISYNYADAMMEARNDIK